MSAVGLLIGEGGIGFIHGGDGDRVSGLEATQLELLFEVVIGDETVALGEIGFEEHDLDFIAFTFRHRIHDLAVGVLRAASGFDRLLLRATAIHFGGADDEVRDRFSAFAEGREHHHSEVLDSENLLSDIRGDLGTMLAHRVAEFVDGVFDLAVGHFGCSHDLCHGVILSYLISLYAEEALWAGMVIARRGLSLSHFSL